MYSFNHQIVKKHGHSPAIILVDRDNCFEKKITYKNKLLLAITAEIDVTEIMWPIRPKVFTICHLM